MTRQLARAAAIKPGDMLSPDLEVKTGTVLVLDVKPVQMGRRDAGGRTATQGFEVLMFEIETQKKFTVRYQKTQTTSWYHHVAD